MNAGFTAAWITLVFAILLSTGWRPLLFPDWKNRIPILWTVLILLLLLFPWSIPLTFFSVSLQIHISVLALLLLTFFLGARVEKWRGKGYLALSALLIAFIWVAVHRLYSFDPSLHFINVQWDCALFVSVATTSFAMQAKHQLIILTWGTALGELIVNLGHFGTGDPIIGSLMWWDSLSIAIAGARLLSMMWSGLQHARQARA